jgi:hypothetical protein
MIEEQNSDSDFLEDDDLDENFYSDLDDAD